MPEEKQPRKKVFFYSRIVAAYRIALEHPGMVQYFEKPYQRVRSCVVLAPCASQLQSQDRVECRSARATTCPQNGYVTRGRVYYVNHQWPVTAGGLCRMQDGIVVWAPWLGRISQGTGPGPASQSPNSDSQICPHSVWGPVVCAHSQQQGGFREIYICVVYVHMSRSELSG